MYQCWTDGPARAKLYGHWTTDQYYLKNGLLPYVAPWNFSYSDDALFLNGGNTHWCSTISQGALPISSVTGIPRFQSETPYPASFKTERPTNVSWNRKYDWENYGSLLGLNSFMTDDEPRAHLLEKQVFHPSYVGDLTDDGCEDNIHALVSGAITDIAGASTVPIDRYVRKPGYGIVFTAQKTDVNGSGYLVYTSAPAPYTGPSSGGLYDISFDHWTRTKALVAYLQDVGPITEVGGGLTRRWSNVVDNSTINGELYNYDLLYDYEMGWYNAYMGDYIAHFSVHLKISVGFNTYFDDHLASETQIFDMSKIFFVDNQSSSELVSWTHPAVGVNTPTIEPVIVNVTQWAGLMSQPFQATEGAIPNFVSYRMAGSTYLNRRHRRFQELVFNQLGNLRPASFISSSKGLEDYLEVIKNNSLQNLQHLGDLVKLLPNLRDLPRLLAKAMRGDPSAIIDLIDYVTEAILKYRFAQKPTHDAADEIARIEFEKELRRLLSTSRATIYGKFHYEFSDQENFIGEGTLVLDVHSKLRIAYDASTLLNGLLMANSVGLLPTLSRIWELLPFSFVIDWFTNMNNRIKQVDNQLTWLAVHSLWSLHSFSVTYYPSYAELQAYNLKSTVGGEPFGIKMYYREFTRCTPRLWESKFDFLRRPRGPDPVTVGALVWQLLK